MPPPKFYTEALEKFTDYSVKLDNEVNNRALTDVPVNPWRVFTYAANGHLVLASCLFIGGCVCFCLGIQFSILYDSVNCSDGTNVFPPLLNLMAAFTGLFAMRTLHFKWPAFVHLLSLFISLPCNAATAIDLTVTSFHWVRYWERQPSWATPSFEFMDWAGAYQCMDLVLAAVALLNIVAAVVLLVIYSKYWIFPRRIES